MQLDDEFQGKPGNGGLGRALGVRLWAIVGARLQKGVELLPELRDREVGRSMTRRRARSQSQAARGASSSTGIPEEDELCETLLSLDMGKCFDYCAPRALS